MEKIWLKNYQDGVPAEINPDNYRSLIDFFEQTCEKFADFPALENMGSSLTYKELDESSRSFAAYLQHDLLLKKGDRIAIMMPNVLQYPIALFGALRAGLIVVNVNPLYTKDELSHQLKDSGAKTIVVLANFARTVAQALKLVKIDHVIVTELGDMFSWLKKTLVNFVVRYIKRMVPSYQIPNLIHFKDVITMGADLELQAVDISSQDIAFLQYTGGTTGVAKGAVLTHRNMIANIEQSYAMAEPRLTIGEDIFVTPLPLYHIFSLTANLLLCTKIGSKNILITNPRDIPHFVKEIKDSGFTIISGVNTLFNALIHNEEFLEVDFSKLKFGLGGGMAVQQYVAEKWQDVTGTPLIEGYGLTETSPVVTINPVNIKAYNGSIGLPLPSTEISIRDEDDNELALNEPGELCVRGPQVMQGYWNRPDETQKVLSHDGWLRTGDIAQVDDEGFVYIVDRKKDMILVSGFNVYPNEVENILVKHPDVVEAGVIGIPNGVSGEAVKAYIVTSNPELTQDQIIAHCRKSLTGYKVPKLIEFRDDLPKTPIGKILRRELRG